MRDRLGIGVRQATGQFARFIARVHRRLLAVRALESAGLGLLAGCAVALVAIPLLLHRDAPALGYSLAILGLSAAAGLLWFVVRRPTLIDACFQADRQLDLDDLLSTAWILKRGHGDDAFSGAVLAMAESRCAVLSPSSVLLNRLGRRAWGGIALSTALVISLALISVNPAGSQASDPRMALLKPTTTRPNHRNGAPRTWGPDSARTVAMAPDHPGANPENDGSPGTTTTTARNPGNGDSTNSTAERTGAGSGSGRSDSTNPNDPLSPTGTNATRSGPEKSPGGGASGDGRPGSRTGSGTSTSATKPAGPVPPWSSSTWPAAQSAAESAVRENRIPPAYHDLIREYFRGE